MEWGIGALAAIAVGGATGYMLLGFSFTEALYQTAITVSTVGFNEVRPLTTTGRWFTMGLILFGVGATLYTFTVLLETLVEGRLTDLFGRRRMERRISEMADHVVVCGWGRVGRATAEAVARSGRELVVIDNEPERVADVPFPYVLGDATEEETLIAAGLERASVLVAALNTDADNLYVTLTGRAMNPKVFIVARARQENGERRLLQAGADRVVNPQQIGGSRMAAFALQPHVAEFFDVVMHDASLEFRLEDVAVTAGGDLVGHSLRDAQIRDRTGAMVLAVRGPDGRFLTNPSPDTVVTVGQVLIAIGTPDALAKLERAAGHPDRRPAVADGEV